MAKKKIDFRKQRLKLSSLEKHELNKKLKDIPALIYYYGDKQTTIQYKLDKLELQLEVAEGKISSRIRVRNAKKAISETHVRALTNASEEIQQLKGKITELSNTLRQLKLKIKSLGLLKEVIENIGHNVRKEKG